MSRRLIGPALLVTATLGVLACFGDNPFGAQIDPGSDFEIENRVPTITVAPDASILPGQRLPVSAILRGPNAEWRLSAGSTSTAALRYEFDRDTVRTAGGVTVGIGLTIIAPPDLPAGSEHVIRIEARARDRVSTGVGTIRLVVPARLFQLTPTTITIDRGASITRHTPIASLVSVAPSWAPRVALSVDSVPRGISITVPTAAQTDSAPVRVAVDSTTPFGTYVVPLIGRLAGTTERAELRIVVERGRNESVRVMPTRRQYRVVAGTFVDDTVRVQRVGGDPADPVTLSLLGAPAGVSASFTPSTLHRDSITRVRLHAARDVAPGVYPMELYAARGEGANLVRGFEPVTLEVIAPDLQATIAPSEVTIPAGTSARVRLNVQRTGVSDTLDLQAVSLPSLVVTTLGTTRLTDSSTTVDIQVPATTPPGTYAMWVRVRGAGIERTATYRVFVTPPPPPPSDYGVQLSTDSVSMPAGSAVRVPLTLSRLGRFVNMPLTLEARASGGFDTWVTPSRNTGTSADVQLVARATTAPGRYPVVVRALAGDSVRVDTLHVTVTAATGPDFTLVPEMTSVTLQSAGYYAPGPEVLVPIMINRSGGFADAVSLTFPNAPPGVYLSITPSTTAGSLATLSVRTGYGSTPGVLVLTIRGTAGSRVRETQMTLVVP